MIANYSMNSNSSDMNPSPGSDSGSGERLLGSLQQTGVLPCWRSKYVWNKYILIINMKLSQSLTPLEVVVEVALVEEEDVCP